MILFKPVQWTLETAREEVHRVQMAVRQFAYHVALGGGVLNNGESCKDLDLYFLPLDTGVEPDPIGLITFLETLWGPSSNLVDPSYGPSLCYEHKLQFNTPRRIDAFVTPSRKAI